MNTYKGNSFAREFLEEIIEERMNALIEYAKLPNAKETYVQKENQLIANLHIVYNAIVVLQGEQIWEKSEELIKELESKDPFLCGHRIEIRLKPSGNNFSRLTINSSKG